MSENLTENGVWFGVIIMVGVGMILTFGASNLFVAAGANLGFLHLVAIEYIAGIAVWIFLEFLVLSGYSWEWHVRAAVIGSIVLMAGIVLNLAAQGIT